MFLLQGPIFRLHKFFGFRIQGLGIGGFISRTADLGLRVRDHRS